MDRKSKQPQRLEDLSEDEVRELHESDPDGLQKLVNQRLRPGPMHLCRLCNRRHRRRHPCPGSRSFMRRDKNGKEIRGTTTRPYGEDEK